jgi:4-amino-4-deoxy-L-arabinose transferase-like glycosyltransferase
MKNELGKVSRPHIHRISTVSEIMVFCLVWAVVQWLSSGNLDGYNDMLENYAWSQSWDWGTHKHPPFFAWVVGVWFSLFPQTDITYRLLSYANVAVALWGVISLARRLGVGALGSTAVLLLMWSFPYSTLAAKFNANSQLLSLWPWTAVWLLASWQERGARAYLFSVLLGLGAAMSMLSKYYSGIFLLGFLCPILLTEQGRRWLKSPRPYLALLVFCLALLPHVLWVIRHDWVTFKYAGDQGGGGTSWGYVLRFALVPLYYWLPAWLGCLTAHGLAVRRQGGRFPGAAHLARLAWRSWQPKGWGDVLFWLAFGPWFLTLIFGIAGAAELSTPWAIPIGYAYSLLWLRNLQKETPQAMPTTAQLLHKAFAPVLALVVLFGLVLALTNANTGRESYYRPNREAAQVIANRWKEKYPDIQLGWASGAWAENTMLAFYALPHVRTLPGFPDEYPTSLSPHKTWESEGGVVICPLGMMTATEPRQAGQSACEQEAQAWLRRHGFPLLMERIEVRRQGWAFPRSLPFAYAMFDVMPSTGR